MDGLTAMRLLRERVGPAPIVVITAFGNLDTAVRAIEGGAFDYLTKPFDLEQAAAVVNRALHTNNGPHAAAIQSIPDSSDALVGSSPPMQEVFKRVALVAPTDVSVLITGESGTGKELVARAIHRHSQRHNGPFLPVCLAALSPSLVESELFGHVRGAFTGATQDRKGLFDLAQGGTVLLDEIAETTPGLQVKLLRAIERREITPVGDVRPHSINVRVLAATNRPLPEVIAAGDFREDLYFRLNVFHIHLPPLRERRDDILPLAEHFIRHAARRDASLHISSDLSRELTNRSWPGNVRELRNAVEHALIVARGGPIRPDHLPPALAFSIAAPTSVEHAMRSKVTDWAAAQVAASGGTATDCKLYERLLDQIEPPVLRVALDSCRQNRAAAAKLLGLHRATLRQKLNRHGIE
jgi:two-component system nitrogen regulation response regulator GlnG